MSAFVTIEEVVEDACHAMDDYLLRNKMKFLKLAKRVYNDDLKLGSIRDPVRKYFNIDKRTNTIQMPCDFHRLSGVSWKDKFGQLHPMYRNDRLNEDIVDVKAKKDCACDCGGQLCNLIKGYESTEEDITVDTPEGGTETFTCKTMKGYDGNGWYYEVVQYPIAIHEDGIWTGNELKTEKRELCKLEYDNETGCIAECEANYEAVVSCGCNTELVRITSKADVYMVECGVWFSRCGFFQNIFNVSEGGDKLIFPSDLPIDKVLIRYYPVVDLKNIKVPLVARAAMITGILYENVRFKTDRESLLSSRELGRRYTNQSFALITSLNPYTSDEKNTIMSPKVYIP